MNMKVTIHIGPKIETHEGVVIISCGTEELILETLYGTLIFPVPTKIEIEKYD
jgi:hypothetical protein